MKKLGIFLMCVLVCIWGYFTYQVNRKYPAPNKVVSKEEIKNVALIDGLTFKLKAIKIFETNDELVENGVIFKENINSLEYKGVLIYGTLRNDGKKNIKEYIDKITSCVFTSNRTYNGVLMDEFIELNKSLVNKDSISSNESVDIVIPMVHARNNMTVQEWNNFKNVKLSLYFSLYPTIQKLKLN